MSLQTSVVAVPEYLESPRCCEDSGMGKSGAGTPAEWGKGEFSVGKNAGEGGSGSKSSAVSNPHSVDLESGKHS